MIKIIRKGIAFEKDELKKFDFLSRRKGYKNRSQAIRDLIRGSLIEDAENNPDREMMATLTFSYNHHDHEIQHSLTHLQHESGAIIRSSIHTHVNDENCLEVLVLQGKVREIKKLADSILSTKGTLHGKLFLTSMN